MKTFVIEQKITAFANQYRIYELDGDTKRLVAFAHQKRLAFREKVEFFTDEQKTTTAFTVRAEKVMDVHGKFLVEDANGSQVGAVRKVFRQSLARSTWQILDNDSEQVVAVLRERSLGLALFRRIWGFLPVLGELPFFMKYHFDFIKPGTGETAGTYEKTTLLRDHYRMEIRDEQLLERVGWQTLVAQAVLLDALQGR